MRDPDPFSRESGSPGGPLKESIRARGRVRHYSLFGVLSFGPGSQDTADLRLHRDTPPLPAMPSFSKHAETSLFVENVLDSKAEYLDPTESVEPLEGDHDSFRSLGMAIQCDQLFSSEPTTMGRGGGGKPPEKGVGGDRIPSPPKELAECLKMNGERGALPGESVS